SLVLGTLPADAVAGKSAAKGVPLEMRLREPVAERPSFAPVPVRAGDAANDDIADFAIDEQPLEPGAGARNELASIVSDRAIDVPQPGPPALVATPPRTTLPPAAKQAAFPGPRPDLGAAKRALRRFQDP